MSVATSADLKVPCSDVRKVGMWVKQRVATSAALRALMRAVEMAYEMGEKLVDGMGVKWAALMDGLMVLKKAV